MIRRFILVAVLVLAAVSAAVTLTDQRSNAESPSRTQPLDDGSVPEGAPLSPFDETHAAVAKLAPPLKRAIRQAARDARRDGIDLRIASGWRSADHQRQLLDAAVARYGSEQTARRYVSTPEKSAHVSGAAVDVGPTDAAYWVIQHGSSYGLCQIYANEVWHFELAIEPGGTCPAQRTDASSG